MMQTVAAQRDFMRGLHNFIADIHAARTKEAERKRVDKELAKIRNYFKENKSADPYQRRKYVSKLIYIYMYGYDVDFGHMEAIQLLSSPKYPEKYVGYLAMQLLLDENHEMLPLLVNSLQEDLQSRNEAAQCLALHTISNIGGREMTETLAPTLLGLFLSPASTSCVKKKSAMAFLRLYRKNPAIVHCDPQLTQKLMSQLDDGDLGVVNSVMALALELAQGDPKELETAAPRVTRLLSKVSARERDYGAHHVYHSVPHPWLQIRCLRFLKIVPPDSPADTDRLREVLGRVLNADLPKTASENHKNAYNAVLFAAIDLAVTLEFDERLVGSAVSLLGRFVSSRETNGRYLALEAMAHLVKSSDAGAALCRKHQKTIVAALREADISIRRRALDLLYAMCDAASGKEILSELLDYLATSADAAIKEELALKIAILAERFAAGRAGYVDTVVRLVNIAGDYVGDEIWFRVVKLVTNCEDVQEYAARAVLRALTRAEPWHETMVKLGAYILGEFGHLVAGQAGCAPADQVRCLADKFPACGMATRALLLSTYAKFCNAWPQDPAARRLREVFQLNADNIDVEVQQRAVEYLSLTRPEAAELIQSVLDVIPPWDDATAAAAIAAASQPAQGSAQGPAQGAQGAQGAARGAQGAQGAQGGALVDLMGAQGAAQGGQGPQGAAAAQGQAGQPGQQGQQRSVMDSVLSLYSAPASGSLLGSAAPAMATYYAPGAGPAQGSSSGAAPAGASGASGAAAGAPAQIMVAASTPAARPDSAGSSAGVSGIVGAGAPGAAGALAGIGAGLPEEMRAKLRAAWMRMVVTGEGVIYQDDQLQVGVKAEYSGVTGRLVLYFGNTHASAPVGGLTCAIASPPTSPLCISAQGALGPAVAPKTQVQYALALTARAEFSDSPAMTLSYVGAAGPVSVNLLVPVALTKFATPLRVAGPEFLTRWKALGQPGQEAQEIFPAVSGPIAMPRLQKLLGDGLRMAVLEGVDPSAGNVVAACTVHMQYRDVAAFVRLETNREANAYRLTVRAQTEQTAAALKNIIKSLL
eukprot:m51a1_g5338 Adaptor protein complex 2 (AP-2), alpha subunit (1044) ;mRNA; r:422924-427144